MRKPAAERRGIAATYDATRGAQCSDLRRAFRLAMMMLRERDESIAKMSTTLQRMHNNFRAIKGLPPQERAKRDTSRDDRHMAYLEQVRGWWFR